MPTARRVALVLVFAAVALALLPASGHAAADPCATPVTNPVACENTKPGTPTSDWEVAGAGDPTIQGFATSMSVNVGQAISFKVDTSASLPHRHPAPRLLRRRRRAQDRRQRAGHGAQTSRPASPRRRPGIDRLRQLGRLGVVDRPEHRGLGHLHRPSRPQRHRRRQPDPVRRAQRLEPLRRGPADLRRDLAGLQQLRRQQPLQVHRAVPGRQPAGLQGRLRGVLQPPVGRLVRRRTAARSYLWYAEYQMVRFLEENGYDVSYVAQSTSTRTRRCC